MLLYIVSVYNNWIVKMATGRDLRRWTDCRARQAQAASGELRVGIEGLRGGGGVAYADGRTCRRANRRPKSSQNRAILSVSMPSPPDNIGEGIVFLLSHSFVPIAATTWVVLAHT